jgi:hypothetical protein
MLFETADLDEFSKVNAPVDKQFDPNFPMRRTAGSEVAHNAAYTWWRSMNRKGFIHCGGQQQGRDLVTLT